MIIEISMKLNFVVVELEFIGAIEEGVLAESCKRILPVK